MWHLDWNPFSLSFTCKSLEGFIYSNSTGIIAQTEKTRWIHYPTWWLVWNRLLCTLPCRNCKYLSFVQKFSLKKKKGMPVISWVPTGKAQLFLLGLGERLEIRHPASILSKPRLTHASPQFRQKKDSWLPSLIFLFQLAGYVSWDSTSYRWLRCHRVALTGLRGTCTLLHPWIAFSLQSSSSSWKLFPACLQMANLIFAAAETHQWYLQKFDNYPRTRRAIIPLVY